MTLTQGTTTATNPNPNATSYTIAHNHSGTNDAYLFVFCTMDRYRTYTGCTYNGVSMTQFHTYDWTTEGQRAVVYSLKDPDAGNNNIVLSFGGGLQQRSMVFYAQSFTGCGGLGVDGRDNTATTPNSKSLTVVENSVIIATGISTNSQSNPYSIGGSNTVSKSNGTSYLKQVEYHISNTPLDGVENVSTICDFGSITNYRVEVKEGGGVSVQKKSGPFFQFIFQ